MRFVVPGERRSGPRPLGSAPRRPRDDPARGAPRPGHRHRASRPQGPGAHRVRPRVDEPEPPARLSDRPRARPRLRGGGHRRQRLPRLRRRHRRQLDRPQPSRRRRRDPAPGRPAPALQRERLLPADLRRGRRGAGPDRADGAGARVHRQLGRGGGRGRAEARPVRHQAVERRRVPRRLPRPDDGRRQPDRVEGQVPRALRPAAARRLPRAVRQRGPRGARAARVQAPDAGRRVRRRHRRADPGRGRLRRPRGRLPGAPARAVRSPRDPADRRRGPVGRGSHRQDVGRPALGRRAGHPADGEGHRVGDAGRRDDREVGPDDLGSRGPRQHVRRQPGRPGGAARDRPAARERPDRQRRHPRARDPGRAPAAAPAPPRAGEGRARQGPDDRDPVRLRRDGRGRPDAGVRPRAARPRGRRRLRAHVAAARRLAGRGATAVRIFAEAVDHVATHRAADREAVAAEKRAGLVSEGFGASG